MVLYRHAGHNQSFHNGFGKAGVIGIEGEYFIDGAVNQICQFVVQNFVHETLRGAPVEKAYIFSEDIADAGKGKPERCR